MVVKSNLSFHIVKINIKVHLFWEDQKILQNLHGRFDHSTSTVEISQKFVAFSECWNFTYQNKTRTVF